MTVRDVMLEKGEYMKTTSIITVAKRTFSEMGEKGLALLLGAVMVLLLAGLVLPGAAFSQGPREAGAIPAPHSSVQPAEMVPPGVIPHKIHVDVPAIDLRCTSQAGKFATLSQDRKHPRHHRRHRGSAASSAAAGGGNGGSAASSAAAGGGGNGGSAASSAAAGGGGGGSAASSAAAGGGGGGSAASSAAAGGR